MTRRTLYLPVMIAAAVAVACAVALSAVSEKAEATFPGKNGHIAYSATDGNDKDIYTINPNGRGKVPATKNDTGDSDPSYSPNGKNLAYAALAATAANDQDIYTINVGGGGRVQVTKNGAGDFSPSWGSQ